MWFLSLIVVFNFGTETIPAAWTGSNMPFSTQAYCEEAKATITRERVISDLRIRFPEETVLGWTKHCVEVVRPVET